MCLYRECQDYDVNIPSELMDLDGLELLDCLGGRAGCGVGYCSFACWVSAFFVCHVLTEQFEQ